MTDTVITLLLALTIGLAAARAGGMLTLSAVGIAFLLQVAGWLVFGGMAPIEALGSMLAFNAGAAVALALRPAPGARPA